MITLGLDLSEGLARAVAVRDTGDVVARAEHAAGAGGLQAAAREATLRAAHEAGGVSALAMAVAVPGEPVAAAVADAVSGALPPGTAIHTVSAGAASVVAETWCGAAKGAKDAVTFAIGERVTAGAVVDGRLLEGAHGFACTVGWLALNPVEREDYRRYGGLEAEVAASGIVRRLVWRVKSGDRSRIVDEVGGDLSKLTAGQVFEGARTGDGVCISVVRDTAKYVGMAVSNLAAVLDPGVVVLGGALAASGDLMLEAVRTECSRRLRPAQAERVRIVLSALAADAVAVGAARVAQLHR